MLDTCLSLGIILSRNAKGLITKGFEGIFIGKAWDELPLD